MAELKDIAGFSDLQSARPETLERFAQNQLSLWGYGTNARPKVINVSENATFIVSDPETGQAVLRLHRRNYHSENGILTELAWMRALKDDGALNTPAPIAGVDGKLVQSVKADDGHEPWRLVLFEFLPGAAPDESGDLTASFEQLGEITAHSHNHTQSWTRPDWFERPEWDEDALLGPKGIWGDWRVAPYIVARDLDMLERAEQHIRQRLKAFSKSRDKYGLIHADMRLANLLIDNGRTQLIDFDDCGVSWFLYDFATAVSFLELRPDLQDMAAAWLRGYRKVRPVSNAEESEVMTFIMLRRLALLAWIGSHAETELAQEMAPEFASDSAKLAAGYLGLKQP